MVPRINAPYIRKRFFIVWKVISVKLEKMSSSMKNLREELIKLRFDFETKKRNLTPEQYNKYINDIELIKKQMTKLLLKEKMNESNEIRRKK